MNHRINDFNNSNLSPAIFAQNLPDYESSFDVTFIGDEPGSTFDKFAQSVYNHGQENAYEEPYMYGSYEFH